jgi:hypothetical protein
LHAASIFNTPPPAWVPKGDKRAQLYHGYTRAQWVFAFANIKCFFEGNQFNGGNKAMYLELLDESKGGISTAELEYAMTIRPSDSFLTGAGGEGGVDQDLFDATLKGVV